MIVLGDNFHDAAYDFDEAEELEVEPSKEAATTMLPPYVKGRLQVNNVDDECGDV